MAKLKFNPAGYQDLGAYALLKNIVENGHLIAEDSNSSLFPNGTEIVTESREFLASDAGKILGMFGENIQITMPAVNPFSEGDVVGIANATVGNNVNGFSVVNGGNYIVPQSPVIEGALSEVVICSNNTINDVNSLIPLSTFTIDDGGKTKTALRCLYDKSQNAIPLSGTASGSPVTGDIETYDGFNIHTPNAINPNKKNGVYLDSSGVSIAYKNNSLSSKIITNENGIEIICDNVGSHGLIGRQDFTANITALDYTQKIYVGFRGTATLSSGTVTVATDKIKTGYKIYVSVDTPSGTQGFLSASTADILDSTSFVINSSNAGDNSTVNWWIAP